jgi:hypothetical protein
VNSLRLVYLQGKVFDRAVTAADLDAHDQVLSDVADEIAYAGDTDHWPAKPAFLCNWCFFKDNCTEFQVSRFLKNN